MENPDIQQRSNVPNALNYYYESTASPEIEQAFFNLDDASNLDRLARAADSGYTKNFVVDFSDDASWTGFNLSSNSIALLCESERPRALNTRWINIWYPFQQTTLLELLGKKYDFSPRLLALMCSDPRQSNRQKLSSYPVSEGHSRRLRRRFWQRQQRSSADGESDKSFDLHDFSENSSMLSTGSGARDNLYRISDSIWHYSSVDLGRSYVCLGYNTLYGTKNSFCNINGALPRCVRIWTWLLLCDDSTVISINEDPFPFAVSDHYDPMQHSIIAEIRRNDIDVLRALSIVGDGPMSFDNPMKFLPIRLRIGSTPEETVHREADAPGLLFYYLFENWNNTYKLITRRESRYGSELAKLRKEMFARPQLRHIDRLDHVGKELNVLRRHFESYNRIIDRVIEPQTATAASLQNSRVAGSNASRTSLDTVRPMITEKESMLGVALSSAARARFKRLRDLIDLYALSEVEEYIKQKDALEGIVSLTH